jgi:hypothetical protein
MKFLVITLFLFMTLSLTWGQDTVFIKYNKDMWEEPPNYTTDTVIFDTPITRQILYGTTVLPWTSNQQDAKGYGLYLEKVSISPCNLEFEKISDMKDQVLAISEIKDSLTIEIKYLGNCCHSFLCDIEVNDDTTVNLIIHGYGATYCACTCCFGLTYHLTIIENDGFRNLKYITINGEESTRKQYNE